MATLDEQRRAAGLKALPNSEPVEPKKERGHNRGTTDDRRLRDNALRGIPCVGAGPGVIAGTRPGDSVAALEQAGRDILAANLKRNRYQPKP